MILQRMQGNVQQTKQAANLRNTFEMAAMNKRNALAKQAFEQAFPEEMEGAPYVGGSGAYGSSSTQAVASRSLPSPGLLGLPVHEFEDIAARVQMGASSEEVERVGREVITRW